MTYDVTTVIRFLVNQELPVKLRIAPAVRFYNRHGANYSCVIIIIMTVQ